MVPRPPSVRACVVDVEVVEPAGRPVAAELRRVDTGDPGPVEEVAQLGEVVLADVLLDAVGAEAFHLAANVDAGLVDRVAEGVAGVAAYHEPAGLRHEAAQVADRAADDDVDSLHRDAAAGGGVAVDDEQAAAAAGAGGLAGVAVDHDLP